MRELTDYLDPRLTAAVLVVSVVVLIGSALLVPIVVARMPSDYFVRPEQAVSGRPLLAALKTVLGFVLVLVGVAMLVLPGQGVLTILAGLSLLRFPGKRAFERYLIMRPPIARIVAALRRRAGRPPLIF